MPVPDDYEDLRYFVQQIQHLLYTDVRQLLIRNPATADYAEGALRDLERNFDKVYRALAMEAGRNRLNTAGLYGDQLSLKLGLFNARVQRYEENRDNKGLLGRALDLGKTVLGSVAAAFPAAHAIGEVVDLGQMAVEDMG